MTQFCGLSANEEDGCQENTGSPGKALMIPFKDITLLSCHITGPQSIDMEQSESPENGEEQASTSSIQEKASDTYEESEPTASAKKLGTPLRRSKRVHHTSTVDTVRQTPMGLPKPLRLPKRQYTIEEIYHNKNYQTPPAKNLETIFEYPKQHKDGSVLEYAKTRKRRKCIFSEDIEKKHKAKKRKGFPKKRLKRDVNIDHLLQTKLSALDEALALSDLSP